jgi:hypothetical protein
VPLPLFDPQTSPRFLRLSEHIDADRTLKQADAPHRVRTQLIQTFNDYFRRIPARRSEESFLRAVYVAARAVDGHTRLSEDMRTQSRHSRFSLSEFTPNDLEEGARGLAHEVRELPFGRTSFYLLVGEKGAGKTTILNYLFLTNSDRVFCDENRVLWFRFGGINNPPYAPSQHLSESDFPREFREVAHRYVARIFREHYDDMLTRRGVDMKSWEARARIWAAEVLDN